MKQVSTKWILFNGLLIYAVIRLINDSLSGVGLLDRGWGILLFELGYCLLISFVYNWVLWKLVAWFNVQRWPVSRAIAYELIISLLAFVLTTNLILTPFVALTDDGLSKPDFIILNIIPTVFLLLIMAVVRGRYYLENFTKEKLLSEQLANDRLVTELKFLKDQFSPHFLFNALNTLYFQMDEDVVGAKKYLEKLSEILRYQLYEDQGGVVSISKEISFLEKYIEIQSKRRDCVVKADLPDETGGEIYPMLLLPMVENAFKYVAGEHPFVEMKLQSNTDKLIFEIQNSFLPGVNSSEVGGLGLKNLSRRLELLYPTQYMLQIEERKNVFFVRLQINKL